jgi:hypothetical protein
MGKGQLLFKGEKKLKKSKKHKITDDETAIQIGTKDETTSVAAVQPKGGDGDETFVQPLETSLSAGGSGATESSSSSSTPSIRKGTGRITTSGTVVTGLDTQFDKELSVGDAILAIIHGTEELRVVTMRLSNTSLNLSSAFSDSIKQPQSFQYIRKPRHAEKERKHAQHKQLEQARETERSAFDLYNSKSTLVYREKTETGSYRIKRQDLKRKRDTKSGDISRGDLLDLRSKKTSDKYC